MKVIISAVVFLFFCPQMYAQLSKRDSISKVDFLSKEKKISESFNRYFNSNIAMLYGSNEKPFLTKMDSLRNTFILPLDQLKTEHPGIGAAFFEEQYIDLNYTFDKFILDYVPVHKRITAKKVSMGTEMKKRLQKVDITNPDLLKFDAFRKYLQSVLEQGLDQELQRNRSNYKGSDNQRLEAGQVTIKTIFKNPVIRDRMHYELLYDHIDNYGIKNIEKQIKQFKEQSINKVFVSKIDSLYQEEIKGRQGHLTEHYKTIGTNNLDLHIFQPENHSKKHSVIVFFHGGGWSEGKPDWFFGTCEEYAKKGWVAVAVEYRLRNRHGTLPPEAISDGKSAIRYLRVNADRLGIAADHIVVEGNSAGANLALAIAVIDTLDDKKENLKISSRPDAVMLNSVAPDLSQGDFWQQYYKNKNFLTRISPLHQIRKNLPPVLIVQGSQDHNVPLQAVIEFTEKMKKAGNDCELHILDGAGHFIWYDRRYSASINEFQQAFLKRLGY